MEYISEQHKFPTLSLPSTHILSTQSIFLHAQKQCSFVNTWKQLFRGKGSTQNVFASYLLSPLPPSNLFVHKEERRASEICCPTQRNATFILYCTVFDYDVKNRKH